MRNTTHNTTKRSTSIFVRIFKRNNLFGRKNTVKNFNFIAENKGSVTFFTVTPGMFKCYFSSKSSGKTAFAFGPSKTEAYKNMISKFNLKYA